MAPFAEAHEFNYNSAEYQPGDIDNAREWGVLGKPHRSAGYEEARAEADRHKTPEETEKEREILRTEYNEVAARLYEITGEKFVPANRDVPEGEPDPELKEWIQRLDDLNKSWEMFYGRSAQHAKIHPVVDLGLMGKLQERYGDLNARLKVFGKHKEEIPELIDRGNALAERIAERVEEEQALPKDMERIQQEWRSVAGNKPFIPLTEQQILGALDKLDGRGYGDNVLSDAEREALMLSTDQSERRLPYAEERQRLRLEANRGLVLEAAYDAFYSSEANEKAQGGQKLNLHHDPYLFGKARDGIIEGTITNEDVEQYMKELEIRQRASYTLSKIYPPNRLN